MLTRLSQLNEENSYDLGSEDTPSFEPQATRAGFYRRLLAPSLFDQDDQSERITLAELRGKAKQDLTNSRLSIKILNQQGEDSDQPNTINSENSI